MPPKRLPRYLIDGQVWAVSKEKEWDPVAKEWLYGLRRNKNGDNNTMIYKYESELAKLERVE